MKYAVNYENKKLNNFDELIISFSRKVEDNLLEFLELNKEKRIVLSIKDYDNKKLFKELCKKYNNVVIRYNEFEEDLEFPHFFNIYINNMETLIGILKSKVTDVYLTEELCFNIAEISTIVHSYGTKVRVFPNVAQSAWNKSSSIKKFFIRPEDIHLYEEYIDILEFYGEKDKNTLLDIYKNEKWLGLLNEIIDDLNDDIDGKYIIPKFGEKRLNCKKKCLFNNKCNMCDEIKTLSKNLEKSQLIVAIDK